MLCGSFWMQEHIGECPKKLHISLSKASELFVVCQLCWRAAVWLILCVSNIENNSLKCSIFSSNYNDAFNFSSIASFFFTFFLPLYVMEKWPNGKVAITIWMCLLFAFGACLEFPSGSKYEPILYDNWFFLSGQGSHFFNFLDWSRVWHLSRAMSFGSNISSAIEEPLC